LKAVQSILWAALLGGTGCRTVAYYTQATSGQCEIVFGQKSISKILNDPEASPELQVQLKLVLELREFARAELKMNPEGNYLRYRKLDRKFVLWVVYATPEFDTKLKSWWYPVVGQFTTRGYFKEAAARDYADRLRGQGLDVFVGGALAYSTLGWFDDPVLSTFIHYSEADLAELIFHELAHHHLFLPGDATFNESFATAVAEIGVARWLQSRHGAEQRDEYLARRQREKQVNQMLFELRTKLQALFDSDLPTEKMQNEKEHFINEFKTEITELSQADPKFQPLAGWARRPINNALLGAVGVYNQRVPAFLNLFEKSNGDIESFFAEVKKLTQLTSAERKIKLGELNK
jgi:predicted aminopeptidase